MSKVQPLETTPQPISLWMEQACEKLKAKSDQKELALFEKLLLAVDKSGLNIKGSHLKPEDTDLVVQLLFEMEKNDTYKNSLRSGLCVLAIKKTLVEKLRKAPRGSRSAGWRTVVTRIKKNPDLAKKDKKYTQIGNYASLLE